MLKGGVTLIATAKSGFGNDNLALLLVVVRTLGILFVSCAQVGPM